jgi:deoxyribodipyrimidine photo-lyase
VATRRIQEERVRDLNEGAVRDGDYVLYWMQSSQRAEQNHALEYAVQRANEMGQRLLVVFGLTDVGPIAYNRPHARRSPGSRRGGRPP